MPVSYFLVELFSGLGARLAFAKYGWVAADCFMISFTQRQFNLYQIKNPLMVPPITRMNLLFTIEKEYTN